MKGLMFLEINITVLVNYEDKRYSDKKERGALLTVLKKICKTKDFLGKKAILSASLFTRHFPPAILRIFEILGYFCQ